MRNFNDRPIRGFTLIEVLIVVALLGVFAAVATDTFSNIMKAQNKARVIEELEQSGNYALSLMEQQVRDAESVWCCGSDCDDPIPLKGVGITLDGQRVGFLVWTAPGGGGVHAIRRCVGSNCSDSDTYLTDTNPVTGVEVNWRDTEFICDAERKRVTIKLVLEPGLEAPSRQDFGIKDAVILETTVVVRGSYE